MSSSPWSLAQDLLKEMTQPKPNITRVVSLLEFFGQALWKHYSKKNEHGQMVVDREQWTKAFFAENADVLENFRKTFLQTKEDNFANFSMNLASLTNMLQILNQSYSDANEELADIVAGFGEDTIIPKDINIALQEEIPLARSGLVVFQCFIIEIVAKDQNPEDTGLTPAQLDLEDKKTNQLLEQTKNRILVPYEKKLRNQIILNKLYDECVNIQKLLLEQLPAKARPIIAKLIDGNSEGISLTPEMKDYVAQYDIVESWKRNLKNPELTTDAILTNFSKQLKSEEVLAQAKKYKVWEVFVDKISSILTKNLGLQNITLFKKTPENEAVKQLGKVKVRIKDAITLPTPEPALHL